MQRRGVIVVLLAVTLVAGACSSSSTRSLHTEHSGSVTWNPCGDMQCASLSVPLDWKQPNGEHITLALARLPARHASKGVLLVNPGGPGGSGIEFIASARQIFSSTVQNNFDIVSWDPRGIGKSAPVECTDNLDAFWAQNRDPKTPADVAALAAKDRAFVQSCEQRSGKELPFVSTAATARDMDAIRAAMGVDRVSYYGFSYGTYLGELYAQMYPTHVQTMVLDGVVDPALSFATVTVQQAAGFDDDLNEFFTWCRTASSCGFAHGGDPAAAYDSLQRDITDEPIPATVQGESRTLGPGEFDIGVASALYSGQAAFEDLAKALAQAGQGRGDSLLAFTDEYTERSPGGKYSNETAANFAISCIDLPGPRTIDALAAVATQAEHAAPHFGVTTTWLDLPCVNWPVAAQGKTGPIAAPGAPPILVIGTTHDPATPYAAAVAVSHELQSGTLLTYDGNGHAAYGRGSDCIDNAVDDYLRTGTPPPAGTRCT
jgi:pimeloyl-ACP methyl ester carboxylesterase